MDIKIATNSVDKCSDAVKALSNSAEIRMVDEKEIPLQGKFFVVDGKQLLGRVCIWSAQRRVSADREAICDGTDASRRFSIEFGPAISTA